MVEWIICNKEWIFSGLGIAIISAFFAILKTKRLNRYIGDLLIYSTLIMSI